MISWAMPENIDNLVLEQLRAVRQEMSDSRKRDRELLSRLSSIEGLLAVMHADIVRVSTRIDDHEERLELLEKRTGLIEPHA
jgi:hypothetical protein